MFTVPENLGALSDAAIQGLIEVAQSEFSTLRASVDPATVTDDQLAQLTTLQKFSRVDGPAELAARKTRAATFAALDATEAAAAPAAVPAAVTASATSTAEIVVTPTLADIAHADGTPITESVQPQAPSAFSTLVASAGVPGYEGGQRLDDLSEVAAAFVARMNGHSSIPGTGQGPVTYPVAQMMRNYPAEFTMNGDDSDVAKLLHVIDERRLPGGSLLASDRLARQAIRDAGGPADAMVASAGWCAPSETDYSICLQISTDGLLNVPEVQARRGGVRHNTGLEFDTIFGTCSAGPVATGFFNLTEAQVQAGTAKTCLEIPCPDFVDTRLGPTGLCLTGNLLAIRGYPEYTEAFTRGALAVSAHQINALQIAAIVTGSTSVTLSSSKPWSTDGTVVSQILSAVEMAIVDIKYRLRIERSSTLEVVMPYWVLAQFRADWIRRNGNHGSSVAETLSLSDSQISEAFAIRGARVQFVYDWQDAFSSCASTGSPGADTPVSSLPTTLQFLVYPAGTWVRAVQSVITLNSIYDSTKLATNQVTHLFTEDGWAMLKMCPISRVYSINICPSGDTGNFRSVTCS